MDKNRISIEELEDRFEMATDGSCSHKCAGSDDDTETTQPTKPENPSSPEQNPEN